MRVVLPADAVPCAVAGQSVPDGHRNVERMVAAFVRRGADIGVWGTCMSARGPADDRPVAGTRRSTLEELADGTLWGERVLT